MHADTADESGDVAKLCTGCYNDVFDKAPSREIPFKANSLSALYAQVRTRYFEASSPPKSYTQGLKALRRLCKRKPEPGLATFLAAPPAEQRKLLRGNMPDIIGADAMEQYKQLSFEVPLTDRLRLTSTEVSDCKRLKREGMEVQQTDGRQTINDVQRLIRHAAEVCKAFNTAKRHPCLSKLDESSFVHEIEAAWGYCL